ncbi:MAG: hypothetical protein ACHP7N_10505 [Caulobacterales bacterium]
MAWRFNGAAGHARAGFALALGLAAASLASCDSKSFSAAFDKSFNEAFDKSTHDSCVTAATGHGVAADVAERYCTCVVVQLRPLSVQEKQNLTHTPEKLTAAADACKPASQ